MWNRLSRLLALFENTTVGVLIIYSSVMLFTQIMARAVFNTSFSWAEESVRYAIIWMVFMASSIAFRNNAHISIDVIKQIIPKALQKPFQVFICLICLTTTFLLAWFGWQLTSRMMMFGQLSSAMELPMYWFYLAIPVSSACMFIRISESLLALFIKPKTETDNVYVGA
ncbi:TRAP transporter small permease [Vibrio sp. EJY3]|uniref:TRAP transporter small permease n=1 Tax=Vibrio sp. (strain EJY3) TaxID=1116375 RepID=UPI000243B8BB|nr:TRAP transporter small permease [Vibrio sp. EJY3]AEX24919.1 C4-dicarboxylate transport system permease small protein [Vibrio sp. EJY3]